MKFMNQNIEANIPQFDSDRMKLNYALNELNLEEIDACNNIISQSKHTTMQIMPNHSINVDGKMQGFKFTANLKDPASCIPMSKSPYDVTCLYECDVDTELLNQQILNRDVMRIVENIDTYSSLLQEYKDLLVSKMELDASFECMPEEQNESEFNQYVNPDTKEWKESFPGRVGVYHAFFRSHKQETRQHKIFIIVSGNLRKACEEFYNIWLDCGEKTTVEQIAESEEYQWLKAATVRNNNRIAAQVARMFELNTPTIIDYDDPTKTKQMLIPTTMTANHEMLLDNTNQEFVLTSECCLTNRSPNGILYDMQSSEGFYLFKGHCDSSDTNEYGCSFHGIQTCRAFPSKTVRYHARYPPTMDTTCIQITEKNQPVSLMFPDERYYNITEQMGFNRNDGIITMMPLVSVES